MADTEPIYKCEKCSKPLDVGGVRWAICEHCERELCTDCGEFGDEDNLCGECREIGREAETKNIRKIAKILRNDFPEGER